MVKLSLSIYSTYFNIQIMKLPIDVIIRNLKNLLRPINFQQYQNSSFSVRLNLNSTILTVKKHLDSNQFQHLYQSSEFQIHINLYLRYQFQQEQQLHQCQYQQYSHLQILHRNFDLQSHQVLLVESQYLLLVHYFKEATSKKVY